MVCQIRRWIVVIACACCLWVASLSAIAPPVSAVILTQEESPGQILYQSRHRLRDKTGHTWQSILYKRVTNGDSSSLTLRLVGFPGTVEIVRTAAIEITTPSGETIALNDRFEEDSPAANVGEYDMEGAIGQFPKTGSLGLSLKTAKGTTQIEIPLAVVVEWQDLRQR